MHHRVTNEKYNFVNVSNWRQNETLQNDMTVLKKPFQSSVEITVIVCSLDIIPTEIILSNIEQY